MWKTRCPACSQSYLGLISACNPSRQVRGLTHSDTTDAANRLPGLEKAEGDPFWAGRHVILAQTSYTTVVFVDAVSPPRYTALRSNG